MKSKFKLSLMAFAAIVAVSCTGNKSENTVANENHSRDAVTCTGIKGQWFLENIVFSETDYVRPSEEVSGIRQYITFEDSTYFIRTNCNTFSGSYTIKGDSITLGDGVMTEKACDNMATEDAIRKILPDISTVCIENDSIVRLNSINPSEYIVLRKVIERK